MMSPITPVRSGKAGIGLWLVPTLVGNLAVGSNLTEVDGWDLREGHLGGEAGGVDCAPSRWGLGQTGARWPWPSGISPLLEEAPKDLDGQGLGCWREVLVQRGERPFMGVATDGRGPLGGLL